ncbi:MAG: hypothetical protein Rsou_1950 [Candidatus Ruthia sp. Asou_11_S2]|nr:hypothetical protein [Candidatus Ruthia sp. Asou_11_S2]
MPISSLQNQLKYIQTTNIKVAKAKNASVSAIILNIDI